MRRAFLLLFLTAPVLAVGTSHWTQNSEADFKAGTCKNVVPTNLGDLKLSRAVKVLMDQNPHFSAVYALAEGPDGTIYAGTGPQGVLLRIDGDKVTELANLGNDVNLYSLLVDRRGRLLIGTGGEKGKIYRIEKSGERPHEIFSDESVQYIWAMLQTPDGLIYAATGPHGKLFQINPDDTHETIYDSDENNLLCMTCDGKDLLYVGTDPDGLVARINRKTHDVFIMYNAAESEISALALDAAGNLYAGTSEMGQKSGDASPMPESAERAGRPESQPEGSPIPANPPAGPPTSPRPPSPIPKSADPATQPLMMVDSVEPHPAPSPANSAPNPSAAAPESPHLQATPPFATNNAIYRIDPQGFVTEVFRQPVMVLSLSEHEGTLLVATGSDGLIYQVRPAAEETIELAKVDSKQVMCLLAARDGRVLMGLANAGAVTAMTSGFAAEGTYTSPVLDARQVSRYGKIHLDGSLPDHTALSIATRSGNVKAPAEAGWSKWSDPIPAAQYVQTLCPPARFLQYRLTFTSTDRKSSPVVHEVDVAYQVPNLPPLIKTVKLSDAAPKIPQDPSARLPGGTRVQTITWEASDPNGDSLEYSLDYRLYPAGPWIRLKNQLKDTTFEWDTRLAADGRYQIRVTASDAAANEPGEGLTASRVSDPMVVDNTPPRIEFTPPAPGPDVRIELQVSDHTSTVADVEYSVDSNDDWQTVLPVDKIFDSPRETVRFHIGGLTPGAHQVAVRATDARGNMAYLNIPLTIPGPTAGSGK